MSGPPVAADASIIERASDWLNPILVKETRQSLKSRQFMATFFLMLTAAWLISVFGIVISGAGVEYRAIGGAFFFFYYVVLSVAIFLIVPFGAFRSLLSERDLHTWEVLSITTLKPRQIVWGKFASAVVQLFIYYSAITPFIAFAKLLNGIDVPTIAFVLVASMLGSMVLTLVALTASTLGSQRYWQVFLTLGMLGGLLMCLFFALTRVGAGMQFGFGFDEPGFWWAIAVMISFVAAYGLLLLQIAIAQLTFDADNRSSGIRLAAAGIFWLALLWFLALLLFGGTAGLPSATGGVLNGMLMTFTILSGIHWFMFGLFAATEPDVLSRRVRRDLGRLGLFRVLAAPFVPGGGRGLVYLIGHMSILLAFVIGASLMFGTVDELTVRFAMGVWCYSVIFIGLGAALSRVARSVSGDFRPSHARVLTMLFLAVASILPQTLYFLDRFRANPNDSPVYFISDPFSTLYRLREGSINTQQSNLLLFVLGIGAVVSLVVNLRAMLAGMSDVARPYVPPAPAVPREVIRIV
ncbi:MAG: hypothetical protein EXS05_08480 [Planctomycetaceae bacterium]|nr:hypothetical protein [Planctomycetaceae bacterium]